MGGWERREKLIEYQLKYKKSKEALPLYIWSNIIKNFGFRRRFAKMGSRAIPFFVADLKSSQPSNKTKIYKKGIKVIVFRVNVKFRNCGLTFREITVFENILCGTPKGVGLWLFKRV